MISLDDNNNNIKIRWTAGERNHVVEHFRKITLTALSRGHFRAALDRVQHPESQSLVAQSLELFVAQPNKKDIGLRH